MSYLGQVGEVVETGQSGGVFSFEWRIPNFPSLSGAGGDCYTSPFFEFGGEEWYFQIHPHGISRKPPSKMVNLFLYRMEAGPPQSLSFTLGIRGPKGVENKKTRIQEISKEDYVCSWNGFCSRSELRGKKSRLMAGNKLVVTLDMKSHVPSAPTEQQSSGQCIICFEKPTDSVLYRCGHLCMCYDCASKLWKSSSSAQCPMCRNSIQDVIKVYK